ncbi:MAG: DUF4175 family protein [Rhodospirillales bacterium]|nr:DUF4175 family protein [Rhodospirillales bacterium]MCB9996065.1 DUF4175 family protein [Rhodospirillales bacterium]
MSSQQQKKPAQDPARSKFARQFRRAVRRARWAGFAERAVDRTVPTVGALSAAFLTASWAGLWQHVSPSVKMTGVSLFAVALATALASVRKVKPLSRDEALARLDRNAGIPGRTPAASYDDIPNDPDASADDKLTWDLQRRRIERMVGEFKAGGPQPTLPGRDRYRLRYAAVLATGLAFAAAFSQGQEVERVAAAFDWEMPYMPRQAKIDAWVTPPDYTEQEPIALSSRKQGVDDRYRQQGVTVPEGSILTLRVHEQGTSVSVKGGISPVDQSCQVIEQDHATRCQFELASTSEVTVHRRGNRDVSWTVTVTPDKPPVISITPAEEQQNGANKAYKYTLTDEYGAEVTGIRILPGKSEDPEARPLPAYGLPKITVPAR